MQTDPTFTKKSSKQLPNAIHAIYRARVGKNDARYWLPRLYRPVNSQGKASPHWWMQLQFRGRRLAFGLHTANREAAARRAAGIYEELCAHGVEKTLSRHRAAQPEAEGVATVGESLCAAQGVMSVRPASFAAYAGHLRRIVGDIIGSRSPRKARVGLKRATRSAIEDAPLSVLTAASLQQWRLAFVSRVDSDGAKARSARISANSIIRQAASLFSPRVQRFLVTLRLPDPLPFAAMERFPRESMRYISRIDPGVLLCQAQEELADTNPDAFLAILLALAAGLRRGELDRLRWLDIDLVGRRIIIEDTEHGRVKSEDSRGLVDIDEHTVAILQGFRAKASGPFVLEADRALPGEASRRWGSRYRCVTLFEKVNGWLRAHGVTGNKALHQLRKEAGSLIASRDGIFAASAFLRHHDISVTHAFYADKKTRTAIDVGELLRAPEERPGKVIELRRKVTQEKRREGPNEQEH